MVVDEFGPSNSYLLRLVCVWPMHNAWTGWHLALAIAWV